MLVLYRCDTGLTGWTLSLCISDASRNAQPHNSFDSLARWYDAFFGDLSQSQGGLRPGAVGVALDHGPRGNELRRPTNLEAPAFTGSNSCDLVRSGNGIAASALLRPLS